jgi:hypothetical protein
MNVGRSLAATLVLAGLGVLMVGSVAAAPKLPLPPKFWSPHHCAQVVLTRPGHVIGQAVCVGSGGPTACRWTSGHRIRLYSRFIVFTRASQVEHVHGAGPTPGVVRSWTLATRAHPGFTRIGHHPGDGEWLKWPPDFFMGNPGAFMDRPPSNVLAIHSTLASFHLIVARHEDPIVQQERATGCTG